MKANIIKVVEDFPFITVYYESGVIRKYKSVYEVPATAWYFMNNAKVYRGNDGCKNFYYAKGELKNACR